MLRYALMVIALVVMSIESGFADMKTAYDYLDAEKYELAYKEFKPLADKGNAEALNELALLYENGNGVPKDTKEALSLYEQSAKKGYAVAQYNLGQSYYYGKSVPVDYTQALKWYNLAAKNGDVDAQNKLGFIYVTGEGDKRDFKKALKWYRKTAGQGDSEGQFHLAVMYRDGEGVPKNTKEAIKLFKKSAAQGNENAKTALDELLPPPKTFSSIDYCRILGRSAACGFNTKQAESLAWQDMSGTSMSDISRKTQYQSCYETVYSVSKEDLRSQSANFKCSDTKKELKELTSYLKGK